MSQRSLYFNIDISLCEVIFEGDRLIDFVQGTMKIHLTIALDLEIVSRINGVSIIFNILKEYVCDLAFNNKTYREAIDTLKDSSPSTFSYYSIMNEKCILRTINIFNMRLHFVANSDSTRSMAVPEHWQYQDNCKKKKENQTLSSNLLKSIILIEV